MADILHDQQHVREQQLREQQAMDAVTERLVNAFADTLPDDEITRTVGATYGRFDRSPIRDFVPIFVERYARQELQGRAEDS